MKILLSTIILSWPPDIPKSLKFNSMIKSWQWGTVHTIQSTDSGIQTLYTGIVGAAVDVNKRVLRLVNKQRRKFLLRIAYLHKTSPTSAALVSVLPMDLYFIGRGRRSMSTGCLAIDLHTK